MRANLTLYYSSNVYENIIENVDLHELDLITTKYENSEELRKSDNYKDVFERFYNDKKYYIAKIDNYEDKFGHLYITYNDEEGKLQRLNILYKDDLKKTDSKKLKNNIINRLKNTNSTTYLLGVTSNYSFFKSEYNFRSRGLGKAIKMINGNNKIVNESNKKYYNKIIRIIDEDLTSRLDTTLGYFYLRSLDNFLSDRGLKDKKTVKKRQNAKPKSKKIKVKPLNVEEYQREGLYGMPEVSKYEEEKENELDNMLNSDDGDIEIDDFSIEEKDDEQTWFSR